MHVGDVLALCPSSIASSTGHDAGVHALAADYLASIAAQGLPLPRPSPPVLLEVVPISTQLKEKIVAGSESPDDDYVLGDDPKGGANKKVRLFTPSLWLYMSSSAAMHVCNVFMSACLPTADTKPWLSHTDQHCSGAVPTPHSDEASFLRTRQR